jgi:hypothetical protein
MRPISKRYHGDIKLTKNKDFINSELAKPNFIPEDKLLKELILNNNNNNNQANEVEKQSSGKGSLLSKKQCLTKFSKMSYFPEEKKRLPPMLYTFPVSY